MAGAKWTKRKLPPYFCAVSPWLGRLRGIVAVEGAEVAIAYDSSVNDLAQKRRPADVL